MIKITLLVPALSILLLSVPSQGSPQIAWRVQSSGFSDDMSANLDCNDAERAKHRIAADPAGNFVVAGCVLNSRSRDILVSRYDGDGNHSWSQRHHDPTLNNLAPHAVSINQAGDVFFAATMRTEGSEGLIVIKYHGTTGTQLWRYEQSAPMRGAVMTLDPSGNLVLTGSSIQQDFSLLKLSGNSGQRIWSTFYDGSASSADGARAVALDAQGDVYVTGFSTRNGTGTDYTTIKLSGDSGNTIWVSHYNGPINSEDVATQLAVDPDGDVVVSGNSRGNLSGHDFATVKYAGSDGTLQWQHRKHVFADDIVSAIALDQNGDVYVSGNVPLGSHPNARGDIVTVKLSGITGSEQWTSTFNGAGDDIDSGNAVLADPTGKIWVIGTETLQRPSPFIDGYANYLIVAYDATTGSILSQHTYNGPGGANDRGYGAVLDNAGNIIVAGTSRGTNNDDLRILKLLTSSGTQAWTVGEPLVAGQNEHTECATPTLLARRPVRLLATDSAGYAATAGCAAGSRVSQLVTLYAADGTTLWTHRFNASTGSSDHPVGTVMDAAGDVITAGASHNPVSQSTSIHTTKFRRDTGAVMWQASYAPALQNFVPGAIGTAGNGDIIVAGHSTGASQQNQLVVLRYAGADGQLQWSASYGSGASGNGRADALVISPSGEIVVTGSVPGPGGSMDIVTLKLAAGGGNPLWTHLHNGTANGDDEGFDVALDSANNVVIVGSSRNTNQDSDVLTLKLNGQTGSALWSRLYGGMPERDDLPTGIAIDGNDNIVASGYSQGTLFSANFTTLKYSGTTGDLMWSSSLDSGGHDFPTSLALTANNDVILLGKISPQGPADMLIQSLNSDTGTEQWQLELDLGSNTGGMPATVKSLPNNTFRALATASTPDGLRITTMRIDDPEVYIFRSGFEAIPTNTSPQ